MRAKFRRPNESDGIGASLMRKTSSFLVLAVLLAVAGTSPGADVAALAASQGTDLWGGPGAKGAGAQGARFDTIVTVTSPTPAAGAVDFWIGGSVVATAPFTIPANGVASIPAPAGLAEKGAFAYHVRSDAPVTAWSETYNETSAGRYGVSLPAVTPSELLAPGDEATGGGAEASSSTEAGRSRTNIGVVCASQATQACRVEVAAFSAGALVGSGTVEAIPGGSGQSSLEALVPAAAGRADLALRLRLLSGAGFPYAIRNNNQTSDGTAIPLAIKRGAFSTAPVISSFTASPAAGCAPLETTFSWETTGAATVSISGVADNLPPTGSYKTTVLASGEFVLTAKALTGQTSVQPLQVTITPTTPAPTPAPATATVPTGGVVTGIFPAGTGPVTVTFTKHESAGSTFTVDGTAWIYTAGATPGTDVVTITADGSCGPASAEFTATVTVPGAPRILSFESIPARGCSPLTNILLTWQTENANSVDVSGFSQMFLPNSGVETTVTATTSFTLTAIGANRAMATRTIQVPVDPKLYTPIVVPGSVQVPVDSAVTINIDPASVPDVQGVRWTAIQLPSGGSVRKLASGQFQYRSGGYGGVDVVRFLWVNGCGIGYTDFVANVQNPNP